MSFRPPGEKVSSYTRAAPNSATKAKGKGAAVALPEDDPDAVVYEVWHVRLLSLSPLAVQSRVSRTLLTPCLSGNMEVPRIPRISPADAAVHSALHRGWFLHQRGRRFMGVCRSVCSQCSIIPQCADENRYEKRKRRTTPVTETYHFIGYSSLYPFYCFPDKVRLRLRSASLFFFACKRLTLTLFPANS